MRYKNTLRGTFLARPNRFVARVLIGGEETVCHVKNTGRLRELLLPGAAVVLQRSDNPARKTAYDLIAVEHEGRIVNIDSQAPNRVAAELLRRLYGDTAIITPEVRKGASRLDFCVSTPEGLTYVEVKGVTLVREGIARFPDAPTQRGARHLRELSACVREGHRALALFLIARDDATAFSPNDETDADFAAALREAVEDGVQTAAYICRVTEDSLIADSPVPVVL